MKAGEIVVVLGVFEVVQAGVKCSTIAPVGEPDRDFTIENSLLMLDGTTPDPIAPSPDHTTQEKPEGLWMYNAVPSPNQTTLGSPCWYLNLASQKWEPAYFQCWDSNAKFISAIIVQWDGSVSYRKIGDISFSPTNPAEKGATT